MLADKTKELFVTKFSSSGKDKFYNSLLAYGVNRIVDGGNDGVSPEVELLEYHNCFLTLYRREANQQYLEIARLFRRASNKLYRLMLRKDIINKSDKFFNLVK